MTGGKWCCLAKCCLVPASQSPASATARDDALTGHKLSLVPVSAGLLAARLLSLLLFTLHDRDKGKSNLHLSNLTEYHISKQYATCCSTKRPVERKRERDTHCTHLHGIDDRRALPLLKKRPVGSK